MTPETTQKVKDALNVLVIEMTPTDAVKEPYHKLIGTLRSQLVQDVLSQNYFEVDAAGNISSGAEPVKNDNAFDAFVHNNRIPAFGQEKKTLTQLIQEIKGTNNYASFFK